MFESLRRKQKPSGQNIFPNQRVIFCVFFIVFSSSYHGFNATINYWHQNCVHLFQVPDLDSSTLGGDTCSRNLSKISFLRSQNLSRAGHCGQAVVDFILFVLNSCRTPPSSSAIFRKIPALLKQWTPKLNKIYSSSRHNGVNNCVMLWCYIQALYVLVPGFWCHLPVVDVWMLLLLAKICTQHQKICTKH